MNDEAVLREVEGGRLRFFNLENDLNDFERAVKIRRLIVGVLFCFPIVFFQFVFVFCKLQRRKLVVLFSSCLTSISTTRKCTASAVRTLLVTFPSPSVLPARCWLTAKNFTFQWQPQKALWSHLPPAVCFAFFWLKFVIVVLICVRFQAAKR